MVYDFDPRPPEYRNKVDMKLLHNFVISQQDYQQKFGETPMWLNIFKISYLTTLKSMLIYVIIILN